MVEFVCARTSDECEVSGWADIAMCCLQYMVKPLKNTEYSQSLAAHNSRVENKHLRPSIQTSPQSAKLCLAPAYRSDFFSSSRCC